MPRPRVTTFGYRPPRRRTTGGGFRAPSRVSQALAPRFRAYQPLDYSTDIPARPPVNPVPGAALGPDGGAPVAPPATPQQPVQPPGQGSGQPAPPPAGAPVSAGEDPVLQQARLLYGRFQDGAYVPGQRVSDARAGARSQRKQLATEFGSEKLARSLGLTDDEIQAATGNPFSVFARIRGQGERQREETDEGLNQANLFFSGFRGKELSRLQESLLQAEAGAQAEAASRADEITRMLLGEEQGSIDALLAEEEAAYGRRLQRARDNPPELGPPSPIGEPLPPIGEPLPPGLDYGTDVPSRPLENVVPGLPLIPDGGFSTGDPLIDALLNDPAGADETRRRRGGGFGLRAL